GNASVPASWVLQASARVQRAVSDDLPVGQAHHRAPPFEPDVRAGGDAFPTGHRLVARRDPEKLPARKPTRQIVVVFVLGGLGVFAEDHLIGSAWGVGASPLVDEGPPRPRSPREIGDRPGGLVSDV